MPNLYSKSFVTRTTFASFLQNGRGARGTPESKKLRQNGLEREGLKNNLGSEGRILAKANLLSKSLYNEARPQICSANPYIRKFTFSDLRCPGGSGGGGLTKSTRERIKKLPGLGGEDFSEK